MHDILSQKNVLPHHLAYSLPSNQEERGANHNLEKKTELIANGRLSLRKDVSLILQKSSYVHLPGKTKEPPLPSDDQLPAKVKEKIHLIHQELGKAISQLQVEGIDSILSLETILERTTLCVHKRLLVREREILAASEAQLSKAKEKLFLVEKMLNALPVLNQSTNEIENQLKMLQQGHLRANEKLKFILENMKEVKEVLGKRTSTYKSVSDYILKNRPLWEQTVKPGESLYIHPKVSGLARPIQYNSDGSVIVHFTKRRDGVLGKGAFKKVKLAAEFGTGRIFASASSTKMQEAEVRNLEKFKDIPGFVQLAHRVSYLNKEGVPKERLTLEYFEHGSLSKNIQEDTLSKKEKLIITSQLIKSVALMHSMGYLHRDLKPENILLEDSDDAIRAVIADLDSICPMDDENERNSLRGTLAFLSPESVHLIFSCPKKYGQAITPQHDVWALGLILYQLHIDSSPLPWEETKTTYQILDGIAKKSEFLLLESTEGNSLEHLIWEMLQTDPQKRITAEQAVQRLSEIVYD